MHIHCDDDLESMKMADTCPLCRAKTPTSDEESVKYIRPWVKKKKAWAQNMMGQMYKDGTGVKQSYEMAKMLYEQAAQQGYVKAMCSVGYMYDHGEGVEQSDDKAREWYEQAAELGDADAQSNLGVMYCNGQGVEVSFTKARQYLEMAAVQGDSYAQTNLADMYEKGQGMPISLEKAKEWYTKAADQGDEYAIKQIARLSELEEEPISTLDVLVCATCGAPIPVTCTFKKCPCGSVRYCNKTCQKKHWKEHRSECKRLIKEIKRKSQLKTVSEKNRSSCTTDTDAERVNETISKEDTCDPPLPKKEEMNDDGKEKA
jgi:hypothetical protein